MTMKRNQFIEQERRHKRAIAEMVPKIYAAIAVSLHRNYGFGFTRILRVLADTQDLWNKHANNEIDIIKICSDETGIDVISTITAEEIGASGTKV
jgi:hypothetical protein